MSLPTAIMVVDDEIEVANLFRKFIQIHGFNTISFTDSLLALEHYMQNPSFYSLIITDLRMPKLDGIKLAKRIREIDEHIKILLVTAFSLQDLQNNEEFKLAKFSNIIQKPVKMSELGQMINEVLSR